MGDYPLQEINQTTFLQAEGGNHYDLIYTLAGSSWYESVTGQQRHYTLQPLETPPENYEPEPAQVGAYLTAPIGFSQHVIVYLQNLYTDDVYDLELYESNGLAAVEPNALSGNLLFFLLMLLVMQKTVTNSDVSRMNSLLKTVWTFI